MNKTFIKELVDIARKYGYSVGTKCYGCSEYDEVREDEEEHLHFITIVEQIQKKKK